MKIRHHGDFHLGQTLYRESSGEPFIIDFEGEPLRSDSPLRTLTNVYLSPHCAGSTADARKRSGAMAAENLIRALRGERPDGIVNPEVFTR